jgi:outer membrane protein assembly factor BamD (BamD/ComL family)
MVLAILMRMFSSKTILTIILVFVVLCAIVSAAFVIKESKNEEKTPTIDLSSMNDFELGEYYFNHDEDPGGPYDLSLARSYFEKAIAEDPHAYPLAWYQLGRVEFLEGNFDKAIFNFDKQIEYFSDSIPNVYYMIGLTYGYKARQSGEVADWAKAAEAFETFISYAPQSPWPRVDLAWIYFAQGKYESMLPVLEEGIKYRPENPWIRNMYGLALLNTGDKAKALEEFKQAQALATELTADAWGKAYPGNNPEAWGKGLSEFRMIIEKNIELASQ